MKADFLSLDLANPLLQFSRFDLIVFCRSATYFGALGKMLCNTV